MQFVFIAFGDFTMKKHKSASNFRRANRAKTNEATWVITITQGLPEFTDTLRCFDESSIMADSITRSFAVDGFMLGNTLIGNSSLFKTKKTHVARQYQRK